MKKNRAFVRYNSKNGMIVPGSLVITGGSYPQGSAKWTEVPANLCCNSGLTITFEEITYPIDTPYVAITCGMGPTLAAGAIIGNYTTPEELVAALNAQLGYMGEFSVVGGNVVLNIAQPVADTIFKNPACPSNYAGGTITPFGT